MITLIKYDNRKIYSRELNRYVSHQELVENIRAGYEIKILEHKTDKDVTTEVLNQAIVRYAPLTMKQIYSILRG